MLNHKSRIVIALATMIFIGLIASARATVYNPGVSAGQWIKYGNFVLTGNFTSSELANADWIEAEVVDVSGGNVTIHVSGQYKNGTSMKEGGMIVDVGTGRLNGSVADVGSFFLMAGNLQANDSLPSPTPSLLAKINETKTKTYLGTSRTVNVINITLSESGHVYYTAFMIYDQASGVLLEMNMTATTTTPPINGQLSLSVIDTNIFAAGILSPTWLRDNMVYIVIAVVVIIIVIVAAIALTRRKKPPPPPAQTAVQTSPPQT